MFKRALTFVSDVQEFVLVDSISQNKVKILHKVKTCQNCLDQKIPHKNEKMYFFFFYIFLNFLAAIKILCAVLFDFKLLK